MCGGQRTTFAIGSLFAPYPPKDHSSLRLGSKCPYPQSHIVGSCSLTSCFEFDPIISIFTEMYRFNTL